MRTGPWDPSEECQPLNVLQQDERKKLKASKRSKRSAPQEEQEDQDDGASSRQRRKSAFNSAENKRRDSIKYGLEELQRVLPHIGTPEEEKVSREDDFEFSNLNILSSSHLFDAF